MSKVRLEAFSDGVIAILITIMVLELHAPHGSDLAALRAIVPSLLSYVLSFVFLGIYWNNHHHMLHAADRVNGKVLWANLHLLDAPGVARPQRERGPTPHGGDPVDRRTSREVTIMKLDGDSSGFSACVRRAWYIGCASSDLKGKVSLLLYGAAIPLAFVHRSIAYAIYVFVALMWLVPDRRIEKRLEHSP